MAPLLGESMAEPSSFTVDGGVPPEIFSGVPPVPASDLPPLRLSSELGRLGKHADGVATARNLASLDADREHQLLSQSHLVQAEHASLLDAHHDQRAIWESSLAENAVARRQPPQATGTVVAVSIDGSQPSLPGLADAVGTVVHVGGQHSVPKSALPDSMVEPSSLAVDSGVPPENFSGAPPVQLTVDGGVPPVQLTVGGGVPPVQLTVDGGVPPENYFLASLQFNFATVASPSRSRAVAFLRFNVLPAVPRILVLRLSRS